MAKQTAQRTVHTSRNLKISLSDNTLTLEVDLGGETKPSGSGKMNMIASTNGLKHFDGLPETMRLGFNVGVYPPR